MYRRFIMMPTLALAAAACQSSAERAAEAAAEGQQLAATGQFAAAEERFRTAVALRDDVPDIWIARARNQVQLNDYAGAFQSYRNALDQDRSNREALNAIAQLSLAANQLDDASDYAQKIAAIDPGDVTAQLIDATVAFRRGRLDAAQDFVEKILAQQPALEPALVLRSRIEQRRGDPARALALIAPIFDRGQGSFDLLRQLNSIYERTADARGLLAVAERTARAQPTMAAAQLALAKQLLLNGRIDDALERLQAVHRTTPGDATRDATVAMLTDADPSPAILVQGLASVASPDSGLVLAIAQYAITRGDDATARTLLSGAAGGPLNAATIDAQACYTLALAAGGRSDEASRRIPAILAMDPDQPEALTARAMLALGRRDADAALRDARIVVRDDPRSAPATMLLARVYTARGESLLAAKTIADGANTAPDDAAMIRSYASWLVSTGRQDDAIGLTRAFTIRNAASVAGWATRREICRIVGDAACAARAGAILARLHGRDVAFPQAPPEEVIAERDYRSGRDASN